MGAPKGRSKPGGSGRKKGGTNKITRNMRDSMYEAFELAGGVTYLHQLSENDPKTFAGLLSKLIPSEVKAEIKTEDITPPTKIEIIDLENDDSSDPPTS